MLASGWHHHDVPLADGARLVVYRDGAGALKDDKGLIGVVAVNHGLTAWLDDGKARTKGSVFDLVPRIDVLVKNFLGLRVE